MAQVIFHSMILSISITINLRTFKIWQVPKATALQKRCVVHLAILLNVLLQPFILGCITPRRSKISCINMKMDLILRELKSLSTFMMKWRDQRSIYMNNLLNQESNLEEEARSLKIPPIYQLWSTIKINRTGTNSTRHSQMLSRKKTRTIIMVVEVRISKPIYLL